VKKRVLQFIGSFHQGGTERQAVSLTRLLKHDGTFDVFAATLNNEGILRAELDGIDLPEIPEFPLTSFYNTNFVRQARRCAKYLRDNKIDVVHTHDFYTNIFGMAAATLAGVPVRIVSKRETGGMRSGAQKLVEKGVFGRADAIVVNSGAVRDHLIGRSIGSEKIYTIYNGIELERFSIANEDQTTVRGKFGLPIDQNIRFVSLVANLRHEIKNVPMLLRAAKRVVEGRADIHFVIAGEGELAADLIELTERLRVGGNIHFIGRCTNIPALLSMSSACVLTSIAEGFSNSILEYMAAAKPVVATNVGGAAEAVIDGETGFLVASDDDTAMADRLMELLGDKEMASKFGIRAKQIANEKFSPQTQLSKTIELYNSFLK